MLSLIAVSKRFPAQQICVDLNIELKRQQLLQVTGVNGAGKTTLLKMIAGLLPVDSGTIKAEATVEYLAADDDALFPQFTAYDNLCWWGRLRDRQFSTEKVLATLDHWSIRLPRQLAVGYFSSGLRRRVALARLTLSPAKLWLIDEPLRALDQQGVGLFVNLLANHLQDGAAVAVSHDSSLTSLVNKCLELPYG